ncbi:MAG: AAA family ATPase [Pyrinomonadaceae bacterium]
MITKIDIANFGLYRDFDWNESLGQDKSFGKVNIIYGRNYSGKTTISRILKCLGDKKIHCDYEDAQFRVTFEDGSTITDANLTELLSTLKIKVYNSDFVKENLGWLRNDDGTIKAFAVLGAQNVATEKRLRELAEELGSVEDRTGVRGELVKFAEELKPKNDELERRKRELDSSLTAKARRVKEDTATFDVVTYNITRIKEDIKNVDANSILTPTEKDSLRRELREEKLPGLDRVAKPKVDIAELELATASSVTREIKPTEQILDLINNDLLQSWVRSGITLHRDKRETCGFCSSRLSDDLWTKLDGHFTAESDDLAKEIDALLERADRMGDVLRLFQLPDRSGFYESHRGRWESLQTRLTELKSRYESRLLALVSALSARKESIFQTVEFSPFAPTDDELALLIDELNELVDSNNGHSNSLDTARTLAREKLRLSEVAEFLIEIGYEERLLEISELESEIKKLGKRREALLSKAESLTAEKERLEASTKDERLGAKLVNEYIERSFGHDHLHLEVISETSGAKFRVTRGGKEARNLSEGECSLISFCYFVATLRDELGEDTIVFIDDPISSLDSSHIFLIFSLIESKIAEPKNYRQLFISTHNLEFLKYLKKLTTTARGANYFLVERRHMASDRRSFIKPMPAHLREYVTEFNFLFEEVYRVYQSAKGEKKLDLSNSYSTFYSFSNNLRKFLECYLFYRFPNSLSLMSNLKKVFDGNVPALLNRVINEYSHLTSLDRAWLPIDIEEAEQCAIIVIDMIKNNDPKQFESLVQSIDAQLN